MGQEEVKDGEAGWDRMSFRRGEDGAGGGVRRGAGWYRRRR